VTAGATVAALAVALLACTQSAVAAEAAREYELKAAFLYNLARFVEWPARGVTTPGVLTLCVLGDSPFGGDLDPIVGKAVGRATLRVRATAIDSAAGCQILFVSSSETPRLEQDLARLRGRPILTVGDTAGFAERGAVVNFYFDQARVRFEINIDAAQRSGLTVSSQLLRLARIVHDRGGAHD
jgi:hypothetical protein